MFVAALRERGRVQPLLHLSLLLLALFAVGVSAGCAIKLVPDYDKAVVDGLTSANEEAMTLFASVSNGVTSGFSKREDAYNSVIGKFDAVRLQVLTRGVPPSSALLSQLVSRATAPAVPAMASDPAVQADPSKFSTVLALETIIKTFTNMRERDRRGALIHAWVDNYRLDYMAAMHVALTVEKSLQH